MRNPPLPAVHKTKGEKSETTVEATTEKTQEKKKGFLEKPLNFTPESFGTTEFQPYTAHTDRENTVSVDVQ